MSDFSSDVFRLHIALRALRHFANESGFALLAAYDRDAAQGVRPLALEAFERLRDGGRTLGALPAVEEDPALSDRAVTKLARLAAVAIHAHVAACYQAGRLAPMAEGSASILLAIGRAEMCYGRLLLDTRTAARSGRIERLTAVLEACLDTASCDLAYAASALAGQVEAVKSGGLAAVRLAHITRRLAMLAGASLLLILRLTTPSKAAGLRKVAGNRGQLARPVAEMLAAQRQIAGAAAGDRLRVQARCEAIAWVDAGGDGGSDGHTRIAVDAGQLRELRLPRQNAQRAGLAKGAWLYLAGTMAEEAGVAYLLVGRLPLGNNVARIWEDYLISELRPAYDLLPGSIDMLWELPDLAEIGGRNDLHARL